MKYSVSISIVMPCYNYGLYINQAIDSILTQTLNNFEFIIINDGSTDESDAIISSYADSRIRYIKLENNIGNYAARNIGIRHAKGKYIAMMDADDVSLPQRLKVQFDYLEKHPKLGCVGSFGIFINDANKEVGKRDYVEAYQDIKLMLLKDNCLLHPSLMVRRRYLVKYNLQYDEQLTYASDYDFVCKCSKLFPIQNLVNRLLKYRIHPNQISSKKGSEQMAIADIVRLRQLLQFEIDVSDRHKELYLKLLKGYPLETEQLEELMSMLNLLLEQNRRLKLYRINHLFGLFQILISKALKSV